MNWILTGQGSIYSLLPDDCPFQELAIKVFAVTCGKDDVSEASRAKLLTRAYQIALDDGLKAADAYSGETDQTN